MYMRDFVPVLKKISKNLGPPLQNRSQKKALLIRDICRLVKTASVFRERMKKDLIKKIFGVFELNLKDSGLLIIGK